jgi:hypothetical protein
MDQELTRGQGMGFLALDQTDAYASLWVNMPVFQTEIYAILQCAYENIRRAYKGRRILIFSDSQVALTALGGLTAGY